MATWDGIESQNMGHITTHPCISNVADAIMVSKTTLASDVIAWYTGSKACMKRSIHLLYTSLHGTISWQGQMTTHVGVQSYDSRPISTSLTMNATSWLGDRIAAKYSTYMKIRTLNHDMCVTMSGRGSFSTGRDHTPNLAEYANVYGTLIRYQRLHHSTSSYSAYNIWKLTAMSKQQYSILTHSRDTTVDEYNSISWDPLMVPVERLTISYMHRPCCTHKAATPNIHASYLLHT